MNEQLQELNDNIAKYDEEELEDMLHKHNTLDVQVLVKSTSLLVGLGLGGWAASGSV